MQSKTTVASKYLNILIFTHKANISNSAIEQSVVAHGNVLLPYPINIKYHFQSGKVQILLLFCFYLRTIGMCL